MRHWLDNGKVRVLALVFGATLIILAGMLFAWFFPIGKIEYALDPASAIVAASSTDVFPPKLVVTHVQTPNVVKAVYYTSWAAGHERFRREMFDLVDTTEINSVVIDVKDYSGKLSFLVEDSYLQKLGAAENRIPDIKEFIDALHKKGVYVIARISSFQDSYLINVHPEWAVKTTSGAIWKDYKGVKWLDAGAKPVWDYLIAIGEEAYSVGFDELNFDYIRFPSDGNMQDIYYPFSAGRTRVEVMDEFFEYLGNHFATTTPGARRIPISADLFGLTTSATGDLGIGQNLDVAIRHFDFVAPMVYPSHYQKGFNGIPKPATEPYAVVKAAMDNAVIKAYNASTTPLKLRPWLQDFDLGADYTPAMVRAQIQATNDAGVESWMLWNAGSVYSKEALLPKSEF